MVTTKQLVKELLVEQKYEQLIKLARKKHSQTLKYIQMHLFGDYNQPLRWYAIEALGRLSKSLASKEVELYRNLIRRLVWAMNDESGNVPWSSPEAIGSIIVNQPFLYKDFIPVLVNNALDNPMCHRGLLWSLGKIGRLKPDLIEAYIGDIKDFLNNNDKDLVGYAVWALGEIGVENSSIKIKELVVEEGIITIYKNGKLVKESIGSLAKEALEKIIERNVI